jgi:hypothetical protein
MGNACGSKSVGKVFAAELAAAADAEAEAARRTAAEKAALEAAEAKRKAQEAADAAAAAEAAERGILEQARAVEHARIAALAGAVEQAREAAACAAVAADEAEAAATAALRESKRSKKYDQHAAFVKTYNKFYDRVRERRAPYVDQPQRPGAGELEFTDDEEIEPEAETVVQPVVEPPNPASGFNGGNILTSKNIMIGSSVRPGPDWEAADSGDGGGVDGGGNGDDRAAALVTGVIVGFRLIDGQGLGDAPMRPGCANVEWVGSMAGPRTHKVDMDGKHELAFIVNPTITKTPAKQASGSMGMSLLFKSKLTKSRIRASIGDHDSAALTDAIGGIGKKRLSVSQRKSVSHDLDAAQRLQDKVDRKQSLLHSDAVSEKPLHMRIAGGMMALPAKPSELTAAEVPDPCRFMLHCMHRHVCSEHHGEPVLCCECLLCCAHPWADHLHCTHAVNACHLTMRICPCRHFCKRQTVPPSSARRGIRTATPWTMARSKRSSMTQIWWTRARPFPWPILTKCGGRSCSCLSMEQRAMLPSRPWTSPVASSTWRKW